MNKAFIPFLWENEPSVKTPIDEDNLNSINTALDVVDDRVITLNSAKLDKTTANTMVKDISFDEKTGIFTITKLNGSYFTINTTLERLVINWRFDKAAQQLIIISDDGTEQVVDLSALITPYEFKESDTIILSADTDGNVYGTIKKGSITGDMLEPNYLANVTEKSDTATLKAQEAKSSAEAAKKSETNAQTSEKEALEYAENAKKSELSVQEAVKSLKSFGDSTSRKDKKNFGLVWIYYTRNLMRGYTDIETAARAYEKHDLIVTQILGLKDYAPVYGSPEADAYDYNENSKKIIKRAKELNPNLKRVEYIQSESVRGDFSYNGESAHLNPDGTWDGSTADLSGCTKIYTLNQFIDWFKHFKYVGADGVFFDDWGYDSSIDYICYQMGYNPEDFSDLNSCLNKKWSDLIDYAHLFGLFVITNGGWQPNVGDWYTHLTEDDVVCLESNMITSDGGKIYNGQKSIYSYYNDYHKNGKCLAKVWSLNYFPPDCTGTFLEKVNTYILNMALAAGADYVSVGVAYENYLPDYFSELVYGKKTIVKLSDYIYRISANDHSLEVQKNSLITGVLTENMINQCYSVYDGEVFQNAYIAPRYIDKNFGDRLTAVEKTVENSTADIKSNAISFIRMRIDDWQLKSVYEAYTNLVKDNDYFPAENEHVKGNIEDFTITYDTAGWHGCGLFSINFSDEQYSSLRGKEIEFGVMYLEIKMVDNATAPKASMKLVTESDGTKYISLPAASAVSVLTDNTQGWCYRMTVPADCMTISVQIWDAWLSSSNAGVMHGKNGYCIYVDELEEETYKTWYTNLGKYKFNNVSKAVFTQTEKMYKNRPLYDIEGYFTETYAHAIYKFSDEDAVALRGHTLEIGCQEIITSDGSLLDGSTSAIQFGIGAMPTSGTLPNNVNRGQLKQNVSVSSSVWDKDVFPYVFKATIEDGDASVGIVVRSLGHAANTTIQLKGVYIYDLGEEDIYPRGKESAKTSLSICRVAEEIEEQDPNSIKNALYISDKGRMWMVDGSGEQTDIASVSFKPAVTSGILIGTFYINGVEYPLYAPSTTEKQ